MINIQKYLDKLELLKHYMNLVVEMKVAEIYKVDTFWRMYNEYGLLWSMTLYDMPIPTFENYCKPTKHHP